MTVLRAVALGCGHYLPARVVENAEFAATLETSDEWIRTRTGIERRHFAAEGEMTSDLATAAARAALADAGLTGADIDTLIVATATPDQTFPATAVTVQSAIGMRGGFAFDVQAVCAGFVFALAQANALIQAGTSRRVMVIGAETFCRILDFTDRATCVLFGDGAGALILEAAESSGVARRPRHPRHRPAFRRPLPRPPLRRRRPLLDRHRRRGEDGRPGRLQARGGQARRDRRRRARARGARAPPTSTGWCRTRRTSGS